jgi:hypothetical protein
MEELRANQIMEQSDDWKRLFDRLKRLEQRYERINKERKGLGFKPLPLTIKNESYKVKIKTGVSFRAFQGRKRLFRIGLHHNSAGDVGCHVKYINQKLMSAIPDIEPLMAQAVVDAEEELKDEKLAHKDWLSSVAEVSGLKKRNELNPYWSRGGESG